MEIVRVDQKGRITIPAYARILLGLDPGDRVLMHVDPDRLTISLTLIPKDTPVYRCSMEGDLSSVLAAINAVMNSIVAISCVRTSIQAKNVKCSVYTTTTIEGAKCVEL